MAKAGMNFEDALHEVKLGERVFRSGWNGKDMYVELQGADSRDVVNLPYLCLIYRPCVVYPMGARVPWLASQTDLLTDDWCLYIEKEEENG